MLNVREQSKIKSAQEYEQRVDRLHHQISYLTTHKGTMEIIAVLTPDGEHNEGRFSTSPIIITEGKSKVSVRLVEEVQGAKGHPESRNGYAILARELAPHKRSEKKLFFITSTQVLNGYNKPATEDQLDLAGSILSKLDAGIIIPEDAK